MNCEDPIGPSPRKVKVCAWNILGQTCIQCGDKHGPSDWFLYQVRSDPMPGMLGLCRLWCRNCLVNECNNRGLDIEITSVSSSDRGPYPADWEMTVGHSNTINPRWWIRSPPVPCGAHQSTHPQAASCAPKTKATPSGGFCFVIKNITLIFFYVSCKTLHKKIILKIKVVIKSLTIERKQWPHLSPKNTTGQVL